MQSAPDAGELMSLRQQRFHLGDDVRRWAGDFLRALFKLVSGRRVKLKVFFAASALTASSFKVFANASRIVLTCSAGVFDCIT
jgi:hypothetical protein